MYDWQNYSVNFELGRKPYTPLGWKRRLRRWAYLKTGWPRWFNTGDWMTQRQMLMSVTRDTRFKMRQMLGEPTYKLGGKSL